MTLFIKQVYTSQIKLKRTISCNVKIGPKIKVIGDYFFFQILPVAVNEACFANTLSWALFYSVIHTRLYLKMDVDIFVCIIVHI